MIHYWKEEDYRDLHSASTFADLFPIALRIIERMPTPVAMVSGPISTGGLGSIEANLHMLAAAVDLAHEKGAHIFDQNPFEGKLQILKATHCPQGYCMKLLEDFYLPIFQSNKIQQAYFLPDWQSSTGARWEREQCEKFGIQIIEYPAEWLSELEK